MGIAKAGNVDDFADCRQSMAYRVLSECDMEEENTMRLITIKDLTEEKKPEDLTEEKKQEFLPVNIKPSIVNQIFLGDGESLPGIPQVLGMKLWRMITCVSP